MSPTPIPSCSEKSFPLRGTSTLKGVCLRITKNYEFNFIMASPPSIDLVKPSNIVSPPSSLPSNSETLYGTRRMRGSNFTSEEDICVCRAWIRVSEDPITGLEQKCTRFYDCICDLYHTFKPPGFEQRAMESIRTRPKPINKECVKFASCFMAVRRSKPTGFSEEDMIVMATALLNDLQIQHPNDYAGKKFKLLPEWRLLRKNENFNSFGHRSTESAAQMEDEGSRAVEIVPIVYEDSSPEREEVTSSRKRPVGRKKSKGMEQREESRCEKLRLASESVWLQRERNAALRRYNEILLFSSAPDGCDEGDAVAHFNLLRSEALRKAHTRLRERGSLQNAANDQISSDGIKPTP